MRDRSVQPGTAEDTTASFSCDAGAKDQEQSRSRSGIQHEHARPIPSRVLIGIITFFLLLISSLGPLSIITNTHADSVSSSATLQPGDIPSVTPTDPTLPTPTATSAPSPTPQPTATPTATSAPKPTPQPTKTVPPKPTPTSAPINQIPPIPAASPTAPLHPTPAASSTATATQAPSSTQLPVRSALPAGPDRDNLPRTRTQSQGNPVPVPYILIGTMSLLGLLLLLFTGRLLLHRLVMPKTNVDVKLPPSGAGPWSRIRVPDPQNADAPTEATTLASTPGWSAPAGPHITGFPTAANGFDQTDTPFVRGSGPLVSSTSDNSALTNSGPVSSFAPPSTDMRPAVSNLDIPTYGLLPGDSSMLPSASGAFPAQSEGFAPGSSGFAALYGLGEAPSTPASSASPTMPVEPGQPQRTTGWLEKLRKATTLHEYSPASPEDHTPDL